MTELFPCIPENFLPGFSSALEEVSTRWPSDGNETMAFLAHQLGRPVEAPPDDGERHALDALCRKVDIAKRLMSRYDDDWKKPCSNEPAPKQAWALTVALFIHVSRFYRGDGNNGIGLALKYLNTAFNAATLAPEHSDALVDLVQTHLNEVLGR